MTVVTGPAPDIVGPGTRVPDDRRGRRLVRATAGAGAVVLLALLGALAVPATTRGDLEPTSAAPDGARAVVEILRRQGVDVRTVHRSGDAARAATADSTLVVVFPELLGPTQLERVAATGARLVLVAPDLPVVETLAPFARVAGTVEARVADPGCTDRSAAAAGRARAGGNLYRLTANGEGTLCYPDGDRGSLVVGRDGGREVVVLGQPDVLRNRHLADGDGTAALALRLLGARDRLVWYLPDPFEDGAAAQAPALGDLVPRWVPWVGLQLVVAAVAAMLWRGRRLGRLVTEPLPVAVRAAETQEGRARLYRAARAHGRAGATLRTAALRRVAHRLDVGPDTGPDVVVALAATAAGMPEPRVRDAFLGAPPRDDRQLVRLADELAAVEDALAGAGRGGPAPEPRRQHRQRNHHQQHEPQQHEQQQHEQQQHEQQQHGRRPDTDRPDARKGPDR